MIQTTESAMAIGASTGGTDALRQVLERLPPYAPPIVIVQNMPYTFTDVFAGRLDSRCQITVREAAHGDRVLRRTALFAPGNRPYCCGAAARATMSSCATARWSARTTRRATCCSGRSRGSPAPTP